MNIAQVLIKKRHFTKCRFIESGSRSRLFSDSEWLFHEPGSGSNPGPGFLVTKPEKLLAVENII
jgi:hypothetical protein